MSINQEGSGTLTGVGAPLACPVKSAEHIRTMERVKRDSAAFLMVSSLVE
jgi:hypothetical protein